MAAPSCAQRTSPMVMSIVVFQYRCRHEPLTASPDGYSLDVSMANWQLGGHGELIEPATVRLPSML